MSHNSTSVGGFLGTDLFGGFSVKDGILRIAGQSPSEALDYRYGDKEGYTDRESSSTGNQSIWYIENDLNSLEAPELEPDDYTCSNSTAMFTITNYDPTVTYRFADPMFTSISGDRVGIGNPWSPGSNLKLRAEKDGCVSEWVDLYRAMMEIRPAPAFKSAFINKNDFCKGDDVILTVNSPDPGVSYSWIDRNTDLKVEDGTTFTVPGGTSLLETGSVQYELRAEKDGCTTKNISTIPYGILSFTDKPDPLSSVAPTSQSVCPGEYGNFHVLHPGPISPSGRFHYAGYDPSTGEYIDLLFETLTPELGPLPFIVDETKELHFAAAYKTDDATCYSETPLVYNVTLHPDPNIEFSAIAPSCPAGEEIILDNYLTPVSLKGGAINYTGPGVTAGVFDPASAGTGTHKIEWSYLDVSTGCSFDGEFFIEVEEGADPKINIEDTYCTNFTTGIKLEVEGVTETEIDSWSILGEGLSGDEVTAGFFYPDRAGQGIYDIVFSQEILGCNITTTQRVTVYDAEEVTFNEIGPFCNTDAAVVLTASPTSPSATFEGPGVVSGGGTGVFYPSEIDFSGDYSITYTYPGAGCDIKKTITVEVNESTPIIPSVLPELCKDGEPIDLMDYVSPSGGTWLGDGFGSGVVGTSYAPKIRVGLNETLIYSYINSAGCTSEETINVTVNALPSVSFDMKDELGNLISEICVNEPSFEIKGGDPASGGTYSGTGVSVGLFNPSTAGVGVHDIEYTRVDASTGCSATATDNIKVNSLPSVSIAPINDICKSAGVVNLSTFGTPSGGEWSINYLGLGTPITGNDLNPAILGTTSYQLTYTVTSDALSGGCSNSETTTIKIVDDIDVTVTDPNPKACLDGEQINLNSFISPTGGSFSGAAVSGNFFDPAIAGVGDHLISYSYTSPNGCVDNVTLTVTVEPAISLEVPSLADACTNDASFILPDGTGTSAGGVWSGPGVSFNKFDPSEVGQGIYPLTYTLTKADGSCVVSGNKNLTVKKNPSFDFFSIGEVCSSGSTIDLNTLVTLSGGTFSGPGVTGSTFDPTSVSVGNYIVNYSLTEDGCTTEENQPVSVVISPTISFVNLPANICENDDIIDLNTYIAAASQGGTFSGPGVVGSSFNPSIAGSGIINIDYSLETINGCKDDASFQITVKTPPTIDFTSFPELCSNVEEFDLTTLVLAPNNTGVWSDEDGYVTAGKFLPEESGSGLFPIEYSFTKDGCTTVSPKTIKVNNPEDVTFNDLTPICKTSGTKDLVALVNPITGSFSGLGISGTTFDPSIADVGTHSIKYSFTDGKGCVVELIRTQEVLTSDPVALTPIADVCEISDPLLLSNGLPSGGTYSGPGIIGGELYPSLVGPGDLTYSYSYTNGSGCTESIEGTISIKPVVEAELSDLGIVCLEASPITLTEGTPLGGTYSGTGVVGGQFDPASAGIGVHEISYEYLDPSSGCTSIATKNIIVRAGPAVVFNKPSAICENALPVSITSVTPIGGTFSGTGIVGSTFDPSVSGPGVFPVNYTVVDPITTCSTTKSADVQVNELEPIIINSVADLCVNSGVQELSNAISSTPGVYSGPGVSGIQFYPQSAGVGTHIIEYTVSNEGCVNKKTFDITVKEEPVVDHSDLSDVCLNETTLSLEGATLTPGVYSGPGVSANIFNATTAGIGAHTINYKYTDPSTGCSSDIDKTIIVRSLPVVNMGAIADVCLGETEFELTQGSPLGGTYSGLGVAGNIFSPKAAGVGTHNIFYEFIDGTTGCSNIASTTITVKPSPVAEIAPVNGGQACLNGAPITLNTGNDPSGTYSGPGVISGVFYPSLTGPGDKEITFTINSSGCISTAATTLSVNPEPIVSIPDLGTKCIDSDIINLEGGIPVGGSWSGEGVTAGVFDPSDAGLGSHAITYEITDAFTGCTAEATKSIIVYNTPSVTVLPRTDVCINNSAFALNGTSPSGGVWSGPGVSGGLFDPTVSGTGDHLITYTYTDINGCSVEEVLTQTVNSSPTPAIAPIFDICQNTTSYNLSEGSPSGGVWSGDGIVGGVLYPNEVSVGSTNVSYTVTNSKGCSSTAVRSINILPAPNVTLADFDPVCIGDADFILTGGSPSGGVWNSEGVSSGIFSPASAGVGIKNITYEYTDILTGCTSSASKNIIVKTNESIDIASVPTLCENSSPLNLMEYVTPKGGVFTGLAITDSLFDPTSSGQGTFNIKYVVNSGITGCSTEETFSITVNPAEAITFQPILDVCLSDDPIELTTGTPSGGTYSGPGVISGNFYPELVGLGDHELTYKITGSGCTVSAVQTVTVKEGEPVTLPSFDAICLNNTPITLTGAIPIGGVWSGPGVTAGVFDPSDAGLGTHELTYTHTSSSTGCETSKKTSIVVYNVPFVSLSDLNEVCENKTAFELEGGLPLGGTYSGPGVSGTLFNPSVIGSGTYAINYSYTDGNGCTSTISKDIDVNAAPTVTAAPQLPICENIEKVELTGASPSGGVWSGEGVISGYIYPSLTTPGSKSITYTVTNGSGCSSSANTSIEIKASPSVSVPDYSDVCVNEPSFLLNGSIPSGGVWSGPGVTAGVFDPATAGIGNKDLTYSFTDIVTGCTSETVKRITVKSAPLVTTSSLNNICLGSGSISLTEGSPSGGEWLGIGVTAGVFNPISSGVGTHTLSYKYTDGSTGCSSISNEDIQVINSPIATVSPISDVCLNQGAIELTNGLPSGGVWSGPGVISGYLYPSVAGVGTHTLEYKVDNGSCESVVTTEITVNDVPTINLPVISNTCSDNSIFPLTGATPSGGVWSGPGVTAGFFDPSSAGIGAHEIEYSYTDENSCTHSEKTSIVVYNNPIVSISDIPEICSNADKTTLNTGLPIGGVWSGPGVISNEFDPKLVGTGNFNLTYEYTDANGCSASKIEAITVNESPIVNLTPFVPICDNSSPLELSGASPSGGIFIGEGVIGNSFHPEIAGVGSKLISYEFTNSNGCKNSASSTILVYPSTPVVINDFDPVCVGESDFILTGASPIGGEWSGEGVSSGIFSPSTAGVGVKDIVYTYENSTTGCITSETKKIIVKTNESIDIASVPTLCENSSPLNLMNYVSPKGGSFLGFGITDSLFDPTFTGQGTFNIKYIANSGITGCSTEETFSITVNPAEEITFQPILDVCLSDDPIELTTGTPSGGTYSGPSVIAGYFYPSLYGTGTAKLTYSINSSGCTVSDEQSVIVKEGVEITMPTLADVCINGSEIALTGAIPLGGVWSGPGVTAGIFYPSDAGLGVHFLQYEYTDPSTGCVSSNKTTITVLNAPAITADNFSQVCENADALELDGGSPLGGVWSGPGITTGYFYPNSVSPGTYNLTYSYTSPIGCTSTIDKEIVVNSVPNTELSPILPICENSEAVELIGGTPSGGAWSGTGVSSGYFYSSLSGIGDHEVVYTVTTDKGCTSSASRTMTVKPAPNVSIPTFNEVCGESGSFILTGASPSGGVWSGSGISAGLFDPSVAGVGTHPISYEYTDLSSGCATTVTKNLTVIPVENISLTAIPDLCENSSSIDLYDYVSPRGGTFSGVGVIGSTFDPSVSGEGVFTIQYDLLDTISGCVASASYNVTVNEAENLVFNPIPDLCINSEAIELTYANPIGGTYRGPGVVANKFYPSLAGVGTHAITYEISSGTCTVEETRTVTVFDALTVDISDFADVCFSDEAFELTGASPSGGVWSGEGVSAGYLYPSSAGIGVHTMTYSYTSPDNGCSNSATKNIVIRSVPSVTLEEYEPVCQGSGSFVLTGGSPIGGEYTGSGISGGIFDPSVAGVGTHVVKYEFFDPATGCSNSASRNITVQSSPTAALAKLNGQCIDGNEVELNIGSPIGGTYSGPGVVSGEFFPGLAGIGTHEITYTIDIDGCISTATTEVEVYSPPTITLSDFEGACISDGLITLTGGLPSGGTYSGSDVIGGHLNSEDAGVGVHEITYSYESPITGCTASLTKPLIIYNNPTVSINDLPEVCENDGELTLIGGVPPGGLWSGPGVSGNLFDPQVTGSGEYPLTYSYTNDNGCTGTDVKTITVNAAPTVSIPPQLPICENSTAVELIGGSPSGGLWSGPGIISGYFYASLTGPGTHNINYTVTNGAGCSATNTSEIVVNTTPNVTLPDFADVCIEESAFILNTGLPSGGVWSGEGVSAGLFDPSVAGVGTHPIVYEYTNISSGCSNSVTKNIIVKPNEVLTFNDINPICENSAAVELTAYVSPIGGTFSGVGVAGNYFDPSVSGQGLHLVTYEFISPITGCTSSKDVTIEVKPSETISIAPLFDVCLNGGEVELNVGSPSGGVYSGTAVAGDKFFPSVAGVGTHEITYTIENSGCQVSVTENITVIDAPEVIVADISPVCINTTTFLLTGASPSGGVWDGPGVSSGFFDPATAGVGNHTVTYSFTSPTTGCVTEVEKKILVFAAPELSLGDRGEVCANETAFLLTGASPTGGVWSGEGVTGGAFDPSKVTPGTYTINYSYTDDKGCSGVVSDDIVVNPAPNVTLPPMLDICENADALELDGGSPSGGVWSGPGVISGYLYPSEASVGTHNITYTVTNSDGCTSSATNTIKVVAPTNLAIAKFSSVCQNDDPFLLLGASPSGGVWSGPGITSGMFNPSEAGPGSHFITYNFVSPTTGCLSTAVEEMVVHQNPIVGLSDLTDVCQSEPAFELGGEFPSGGIWSGIGVSGNVFDPSTAGIGVFQVKYSYEDTVTGCSSDITKPLTVKEVTPVVVSPIGDICYSNDPTLLTGASPSGGVWSGPGVVDGLLYTNVATVGIHNLTYTYNNPSTGCSSSETRTVIVKAQPTVSLMDFDPMCLNDNPILLSGGTPISGVYSGDYVSSGVFDPSVSGVGVHKVSYEITDPISGCSNTATKSISVNGIPFVSATTPTEICEGELAVLLTGGNPIGGVWSGPGITSGNYFDPKLAGSGSIDVTYEIEDSITGCSNSVVKTIEVNSTPLVSLSPMLPICENDGPIELTGGLPSGGTYSGPGVISGYLYPNIAGIGTKTIVYTFNNADGCVSTASIDVDIQTSPAISLTDFADACYNETPYLLSGGLPLGGTYSGPGVTAGVFDPSSAGVGTHSITYSYTGSSGCTEAISKNIYVSPSPIVTLAEFGSVCENETPFVVSGGFPLGGTYSGLGISSGLFYPSIAGVGTHEISYTYVDPSTGCTSVEKKNITVYSTPSVTISGLINACDNDDPFELTGGSPSGGEWGGTGVSTGYFYPSLAGPGSHTVTYSYTNSNGCLSTTNITINVFSAPNVSMSIMPDICFNEDKPLLNIATPTGGTYSGDGVVSGYFDPIAAGVGSSTIFYEYTDPSTGCVDKASTPVFVKAIPSVTQLPISDICETETPIILNTGYPTGGTYKGNGVTSGVFDPSSAGVGTHIITYSYTEPSTGCSAESPRNVDVLPAPNVTFAPLADICDNEEAVELVGGLPSGGLYKGPGVVANYFYPKSASLGVHSITYEYSASNGCKGSAVQEKKVLASPNVSLASQPNRCVTEPTFALTGATPAGGVWSGEGVTANYFNPSDAGIGTHILKYEFNDLSTGCSADATTGLIVLTAPFVSVPTFDEVCTNDLPFALTGASPIGGTWSGEGIIAGNFFPADAGEGLHILTYTYTDPITGCSQSEDVKIRVNKAATIFASDLPDACENADEIKLISVGGVTGSWYGPGVISNEFFPNIAGVGDHELIFDYTDGKGCSGELKSNITVNPTTDVEITLPPSFCRDGSAEILNFATPTGGDYSGEGVSANYFYPMSAGIGVHNARYTYTNEHSCISKKDFSLVVHDLPEVAIKTVNPFCENEDADVLNQGYPLGGVWSGPGVTAGLFDPASAGIGSHYIFYTLTDAVTGCSNTAEKEITVNPSPSVSFAPIPPMCETAPVLELTGGLPLGGDYEGDGVIAGYFNPNAVGPGITPIDYTYLNITTGCSKIETNEVQILPSPSVEIDVIEEICMGSTPVLLSGGAPLGGDYSGKGVNEGYFDTDLLSSGGLHVVGYQYTDPITGCSATDYDTITVNNKPVINFNPIPNICHNGSPIPLNYATPLGGNYGGAGVTGTTFDPGSAISGYNPISYEYTDTNGCSNSDTNYVYVEQAETPITNEKDNYCKNTGVTVLASSGDPAMVYNWYDETGVSLLSSGPEYSFTASESKTVIVQGTNENGCTSVKKEVEIVATAPTADFSVSDNNIHQGDLVQFFDESVGATSWDWNFGDVITSTTQDPFHYFNNEGLFDVTLIATDDNGCSDTITKTEYIFVSIGVFEVSANVDLSVFPNPTNGVVNINLETLTTDETVVTIHNSIGQIVSTEIWSIFNGENQKTIDLNSLELSPGNYFIRIHGNEIQAGVQVTLIK